MWKFASLDEDKCIRKNALNNTFITPNTWKILNDKNKFTRYKSVQLLG